MQIDFYYWGSMCPISDEKGTFPNGNAKFFEKNGYHDEKVVFEDDYCRLHLFTKELTS